MNKVRRTVVLIFTIVAFLMVSVGVSAAPTSTTGKTCYTSQCSTQRSGAATYTVKSGDSLYKIASTCGTTVNTLKALNCISGSCIYPGQVICTKAAATAGTTKAAATASTAKAAPAATKAVSTADTNAGDPSTCTGGDCATNSNCSTGNCAASNCTTGNCATGNCATSNCATSNCTTSNCATSNCSTGNCSTSNCFGNTCATGFNYNGVCYSF